LGLVEAIERIDSLDLDYDRIRHKQVEPVAGVNRRTAIDDGHRSLSLKRDSARGQFIRQAMFVGRFQQSGPQRPMNRKARIHDTRRGGFYFR
jgi:hypothetical protein